ncbi:hypothetical protein F4679DRAFT_354372 [Xylaria curta]|nr:hypothetical protein F4679DRAFT_354372 [Xylaria curta]
MMDTPELRLGAGEDGRLTNTPSQPVLQHFDESPFFSGQFESEYLDERNGQNYQAQLRMDYLSQPEDYMHMQCSGQNGMSLTISDAMDSWTDFMDLAPDFNLDDGTSGYINPFETDVHSLIGDRNPTERTARKTRRVFIDDRQKSILTEWISNNPEPYPSKEDKMNLAYSTGLTLNQISSWFTRTRQRRLNRVHVTGTSIGIRNGSHSIKQSKRDHLTTPEEVLLPRTHIPAPLGVFDDFWPSSISLPEHLGECTTRKASSESQSLPPFFTLDFLRPYTFAPSRSSHDHLSLEALVSARWSVPPRSGNQERRERVSVLYHQSIETTTKLDFITSWIADVAQRTFCPSEGNDILSTAEQDATLAESAIDNHGYVIGNSRKPNESLLPEAPEYDNSGPESQHAQDRLNRLARLIQEMRESSDEWRRPRENPFGPRQKKRRFEETCDITCMSSAGSSACSAASASSYLSFGPRKGRRVVFQSSQDTQQLIDDDLPPSPDLLSAVDSAEEPAEELDESISLANTVPRKRTAAEFWADFVNPLPFKSNSITAFDEGIPILNEAFLKSNASEPSLGQNDQNLPKQALVYPCTFCCKEFRSSYIWKRHEVTSHTPQVQWVCGLDKPNGIGVICPICAIVAQPGIYPPACTHRFNECWDKPTPQRAFFRKDALKQHIRVFHCKGDSTLLADDGINLDKWKEKVDTAKYSSICHFCGLNCQTWDKRASHLIKHFNDRIPRGLWIPRGPYALEQDGSIIYQLPVSEITNYKVYWRCPFNEFDLSSALSIGTRSESVWECILCGSMIDRWPKEILSHLSLAHDPIGWHCRLTPQVFSHAAKLIEHLVTYHLARRGDWMAGLLLAALRREPRTDKPVLQYS